MKKFVLFAVACVALLSCSSEDDICLSGESTPRLKILFKDATANKQTQLSRLIIEVDYGSGFVLVQDAVRVDSVLLPLRVDQSSSTQIKLRTDPEQNPSVLSVHYQNKAQYVSPACGFKRTYHDVTYNLSGEGTVDSFEALTNEIFDETNPHLYLNF